MGYNTEAHVWLDEFEARRVITMEAPKRTDYDAAAAKLGDATEELREAEEEIGLDFLVIPPKVGP